LAGSDEVERAMADTISEAEQGGDDPTAFLLVMDVIARARRDGLDDMQTAGGILVVLESHGLLQRDPA